MGSSYSNITLHGAARDRIIEALETRGRQAYVGPTTDGMVVVFDEQSEDDPNLGAELARDLTRELRGLALAATVYDEDIFLYTLARDGEVVDQYNSCPGYFDGDETPPEGGNAALLASAFGAGNESAVERILRAPAKEGDYFLESARHAALAEVLGLPDHSVNLGFGYVYQGEADELDAELARVGFADDEDDGGPGAQESLMRARLSRSEFGGQALAQLDAMKAAAQSPAHGYFRALLAGDAAAVRALFAGEPLLDDPVSGRVDGAGLDAHVAAARALFAGGTVNYAPAGMVETQERVVSHGQITGMMGGEMVMLPCACVWERADGGFRELRAYWSPAGLKGQRGERAPVLQPDPALALPEPVAAHVKALAADDLSAVLATYDAGCLAPMPWADPEDTVRRQYGAQVGQQGAVVLSPCKMAGAGEACAVEFVTTKWDGADVPAQAGLAIYELRGGRICNVHLFGDLAPAPMAGLGGLGGLMGGPMLPGGMEGFGIEGLSGLGAAGGMPGMGGLNMDDVPPEVMQQAMDEAMRMLSSGNLGDIMKNLQQMMGGMGGMGGMPGMGMGGMGGAPGGGIDFGALGGFPGMGGAMPAGWDDELDDGEAASNDATTDAEGSTGAGGSADAGGSTGEGGSDDGDPGDAKPSAGGDPK